MNAQRNGVLIIEAGPQHLGQYPFSRRSGELLRRLRTAAAPRRARRQPLPYVARMVLGRLRRSASGDACQRVTGQRFSCTLLGLDHDRVNGTNAVHRPGGRAVSEKRTLSTDLLAFEQRFTSIDGFDDIECSDVGRGARERKATANSLAGDDDACLLKLGEKLRNKFGRDLL